ncbi:hypothetical protein ACTOV4_23545 [Brucella sp. C7-11G]
MIENINQADIGRAMKLTRMSVSRLMRSLNREAFPLSESDILKALLVKEIQKLGFTINVAIELLLEVDSEFRYLLNSPDNLCWIIFVEQEGKRSFRLTALNQAQLSAMTDCIRLGLVMPLHRLLEDARAVLADIQADKARRAAA